MSRIPFTRREKVAIVLWILLCLCIPSAEAGAAWLLWAWLLDLARAGHPWLASLLSGAIGTLVWHVSLRILGTGKPAPRTTPGPRWKHVTEFAFAPMWAALVLVGDGLTWWIERGERS